jgi:hypothetical protein
MLVVGAGWALATTLTAHSSHADTGGKRKRGMDGIG